MVLKLHASEDSTDKEPCKRLRQQELPIKELRGAERRDEIPKVVRFNPTVVESIYQEDEQMAMESEFSSSRWYSRKDYVQFKAETIAEVKKLIQKHRKTSRRRNWRRTVDENETDDAPARIRKAYRTITHCFPLLGSDSSDSQDSITTSDEDDSLLSLYPEIPIHGCCEVVGIEKWLGKDMCRDNKIRRRLLLDAVDEIQSDKFRASYCDYQNSEEDNHISNVQSSMLRYVSENISAPSRTFAHYLGTAALPSAKEIGMF